MSTSDLYLLFGKSVRHWSEHRNGWGSAPIVWDYLGAKFIPEKPIYTMAEGHLKKVWALHKDERLAPCERAALLFTFDNAYVPTAHLKTVACWFDEFAKLLAAEPDMSGRANHWAAFAEQFREIAGSKRASDPRMRGVCISCTSVNDVWSYRNSFGKEWPITEDDCLMGEAEDRAADEVRDRRGLGDD